MIIAYKLGGTGKLPETVAHSHPAGGEPPRCASGAEQVPGGLDDLVGRDPGRLHEYGRGPGGGQAAHGQVGDADRVASVVERFEHRAAEAARRVVVLDDHGPAGGRLRRLDKRLGVDRLDRVEVYDPRANAVPVELVRRGQAVVQRHARSDQRHLVIRAGPVVVLAEPPGGGEAVIAQDRADRGVLGADDRIVAGVTRGELTDHAEAYGVMVATRNQCGARRRAQRGGMELRIAQACLGEPVKCGGRNYAAKGARHSIALVIGHDQKNVGRAFGRHDARRPPGLGVLGGLLNHTTKFGGRRGNLASLDRSRGTG